MNFIKYAGVIILAALFASCNKQNTEIKNITETDSLQLVTTLSNNTHHINIYTKNGKLQQGYNLVYLQVNDLAGNIVPTLSATWKPMMQMMSKSHGCPYSSIQKVSNSTALYSGYIVFQMAGSESEFWELTIDYNINGTSYTTKSKINVTPTQKRNVVSFKGIDNKNYILALLKPDIPKIAANDIQAMLFTMQDMTNFPIVDNYTINIDPRMPGMGNHGSPNNNNLVQNSTDKIYHGKLSLTMSGYWKINLQVLNETGATVKGEPVTEENDSSSIYFEIEF